MSLLKRVRFALGIPRQETSVGWWPIGLLAILVPCCFLPVPNARSYAEERVTVDPKTTQVKEVESPPVIPAPAVATAKQVQHVARLPQSPSKPMTSDKIGDYIIEPPDILLISDPPQTFKPNYRVTDGDMLQIVVLGTPEEHPIAGTFEIHKNGHVNLGATYGSYDIGKKTTEQVAESLREAMSKKFENPEVTVSLASSSAPIVVGEHLVSPDGTINLGLYGRVYVSGMTLDKAQTAINNRLARYFQHPKTTLDLFISNSKFFFVIFKSSDEYGDSIMRIPVTGNETVLDAIAQVGGLANGSWRKIYLQRSHPDGDSADLKLPVDYNAITRGASTGTNYQLLSGDRLFIETLPQSNRDKTTVTLSRFPFNGDVGAPVAVPTAYDPAIPVAALGVESALSSFDELSPSQHGSHTRIPLMGPMTAGGKPARIAPPSEVELLSLIRLGSPNSPFADPNNAARIRIQSDLLADYVDPPRKLPILGATQLHHAHYKFRLSLEGHKTDGKKTGLTLFVDHQHWHANSQVEQPAVDVGDSKLITKTYAVKDLVIPFAPASFSETGERRHKSDEKPDFVTLMQLIESTVDPSSWDSQGGTGAIEPFAGTLSLVVSNTDRVHYEIAALLQQLREMRKSQFTLFATDVRLPTQRLKQLGLHDKPVALLDKRETTSLLETATQDVGGRVFSRKKAMILNGQPMSLGEGTEMSLQGVIRDNKVRLSLIPTGSATDKEVARVVADGQSIFVRLQDTEKGRPLFRLIQLGAAAD